MIMKYDLRSYCVICTLVLWGGIAQAQQKQFDTYQYPAQSFTQVSDTLVLPYFGKTLKQPVHYGNLHFTLWGLLPKSSRDFRLKKTKYDPEAMRKKLSGATAVFAKDSLVFANGEELSTSLIRHKDDHERYSLAFANFDQGVGMVLDFKPLPYKVYYSPMTATNVRAYTITPSGQYWDKTYKELDRAHRVLFKPDYFYATLDASIRGDFTTALSLPPYQQELLVDSLSISLAEYYQGVRVHVEDFPPPYAFFRDPASRVSPPFFNSMLAQYHNFRIKQVAKVFRGNKTIHIRQKARLGNYYNKSNYLPKHRYVNERAITRALTLSHPYEMSFIRNRLGYKYQDNYFDMLCHLVLFPELYDEAVRMALRRIISAAKNDTFFINWQIEKIRIGDKK